MYQVKQERVQAHTFGVGVVCNSSDSGVGVEVVCNQAIVNTPFCL